jgi:hypothetical protein
LEVAKGSDSPAKIRGKEERKTVSPRSWAQQIEFLPGMRGRKCLTQ